MTSLKLSPSADTAFEIGLSGVLKTVVGVLWGVLVLLVSWQYAEARGSRDEIRAAIVEIQQRQNKSDTRIAVNEEAIRNIRESLARIEQGVDRLNATLSRK